MADSLENDETMLSAEDNETAAVEWTSLVGELYSASSPLVRRALMDDRKKCDCTDPLPPLLFTLESRDGTLETAEQEDDSAGDLSFGQRPWKALLAEAKSFDTNNDGLITRAEINSLVKDPSVKGPKAMAVASLKLFELAQSGDSPTGAGIKIADLEKLNNLQAFFKNAAFDRKTIGALLTKYTEGKCDEKELKQLESIGKYMMEGLGGKKDDPQVLDKFVREIPAIIASLQKIDELETRFDRIARRAKSIEHFGTKLYGNSDDPSKSIKPEAVCQGLVGNCYFMAGVASLAALRPEELAKSVHQNKDGTFTVTFPGKEPVRVKPPTACELMLYAGVTEQGIWPAVLDKAFGKFCRDNPGFRKNQARDVDVDQEGSEGGGTTEGVSILTGRSGQAFLEIAPKDRDKIWSTMADSLAKGLPVIAGTGNGAATILNGGKNSGLESRHAYAVLKIEGDTVTLRNPYGKLAAVGKEDLTERGKFAGTFQLSKEKFWQYFTEVELTR